MTSIIARQLFVIALNIPVAVLAQSPALKDGIDAYNQVEYRQALVYLQAALRRAARHEDRAQALYYLGCTYLALEQQEEARRAFEILLALDPTTVPGRSTTSPKIAEFYQKVRNSYPTPVGPPTMAHTVPLALGQRQMTLDLQVRHLSPRLRPVLRYRLGSAGGFMREGRYQQVGGSVRFSVLLAGGESALGYYFALADDSGLELKRLGSERRPFRLGRADDARQERPPFEPVYRKWWFWTVVGAAIVGTAIGVGVGVTRKSEASVSVGIMGKTGPRSEIYGIFGDRLQ
jgi:tetratricopeptide (TPR) repeat protein